MALTHADLAAQLVAEGALAIAQGKPPAKAPVAPVVLDDAERKRIGAKAGEIAVLYPVGKSGVYFQMGGSLARVWYADVESTSAIDTLDRALRQVKANKKSDAAHLTVKGMKVREYRVDLDSKHSVKISVTYPVDKKVRQEFHVQLFAQEKR
jgi:hypothetical protein